MKKTTDLTESMAVAADHSGPGRRRQPMIHPMTDPPVTAAEPESAAWHQHSPQQAVAALFPEHVRYVPLIPARPAQNGRPESGILQLMCSKGVLLYLIELTDRLVQPGREGMVRRRGA